MAEADEQEGRKKEPPRPEIPDLEPRWTFGRDGKSAGIGRGDREKDTNKKKNEEDGN